MLDALTMGILKRIAQTYAKELQENKAALVATITEGLEDLIDRDPSLADKLAGLLHSMAKAIDDGFARRQRTSARAVQLDEPRRVLPARRPRGSSPRAR